MLFNLLLILDLRTYVPFTPLQLFWQPTPFCPLRIVLVASRRVALSVRYVLNTWRVVQGLVRRLRPHSHCKTSRADWASKTKVHYEMEAFTLHAEPSQTEPDRTGPNLTERVHWRRCTNPWSLYDRENKSYTHYCTRWRLMFSAQLLHLFPRIRNCVSVHLQEQKATHNREVHRPLQNYRYYEGNLRDITALASRVCRWMIYFWRNCGPLTKSKNVRYPSKYELDVFMHAHFGKHTLFFCTCRTELRI